MTISVYFQALIILGQPMPNKSDNRFALLIEISVSIYLYVMLTLTDFMGENLLRDPLGWLLAGIVVSIVFVNVLTLGYSIFKKLYRRYFKIRDYFRLKRLRGTVKMKPSTLKNNLST